MFDEPSEAPGEKHLDPKARAQEKAEESRMHAELAAVFEGPRKFDAQLHDLEGDLARELQRSVARLAKSRAGDSGLLPPESSAEASELLNIPQKRELSTNDYHVYRRPGEVMIARWIAGDEVETFYERLQAHFDAAMEGHREDERNNNEWKRDPETLAYLEALDAIELKTAERFYREPVRKHQIFVLSTHTVDEMNIAYLADYIMSVPIEELVGPASAPADDPSEQDLAWFFKLFLLRGITENVERMFFFAYLQKADDNDW